MERKEIFIEKANKVHGGKYDYSKVEYLNNKTKVCVVCPEHGDFWQTPHNHLRGSKCPFCARESRIQKRRKDTVTVLNVFRKVHGETYDYSKVEYVNNHTKVCIICPVHGEFWQTPTSHIEGQKCPKCQGQYMDREYFIECSNEIHNSKYKYDLVNYKDNRTKVCIICPEHGEFWQTPHHHLRGFGCRKCSNTFMDKDSFIKKAIAIHGEMYDYTKVEYKNNHTKVCIICPVHGEFWQTPNSHLNGRGCKQCRRSHLEYEVKMILDKHKIDYTYQYRNKNIFKQQSLDFYIKDCRIAIECQGEQHFISNFYKSKGIEYSEKHLEYIMSLDEKKKKICQDNNILLVYFLNKKFNKYLKENDLYANDENGLIEIIKNIKIMR